MLFFEFVWFAPVDSVLRMMKILDNCQRADQSK